MDWEFLMLLHLVISTQMWLKIQEASYWITLLLIFHNIELRRDSRDAYYLY